MASGREDILAGMRAALGRRDGDGAAAEAGERLSRHAVNLVPERARRPRAEQIALFVAMAEQAAATVARVSTDGDVPGAVAEYLAQHNLPSDAAMAPDARLSAIPWDSQPLLTLRRGPAEEADEIGITGAFAGIAETGTLMITSGAGRPTTLNFLPATHIVVLDEGAIVAIYEEAWTRLREVSGVPDGDGGWQMPRTVNFVTGPSRTADIELVPALGAHGPKGLHVIIVGAAEAAPRTGRDGAR